MRTLAMSKLAIESELDKLSRTLDIEREAFDFLEDVSAEQLRALRVAVYELLFRQDRVLFQRLASVASRAPVRFATMLAERVLGPMLTARVAAEMPARRAAAVVLRAPPTFLADVAEHLDPRRTRDMLQQLQLHPNLIVEVARELAERGDFMTMSRFVDFLSDDAIRGVEEAIEDEGVLLQVAFYMGSKNRIDRLFRLLPMERLERLILRVADDPGTLLSPFLSLLIHVSYGLKRRLGDLAARQDEAVLEGFVRATYEQGLWPDVLPVVAAMSEDSRRRVVNLPILREAAVQDSILCAGDEHDLWGIVLPMIEMMDDENREAVARIAAARPRGTLRNAADAALMGEHWEVLLDLVARMSPAKHDELAEIVRAFGEVDLDLRDRIVRRAESHGFGKAFELAGAAPPPG